MRIPTWKAAALSGAVVLALALSACGDDDDDATGTGTGTGTEAPSDDGDGDGDAAGAPSVTIADLAFGPSELTVAAGEVIQITNEDGFAHTFTSDDGGFDVDLGGGATGEANAPSDPGSYEFHCEIHPSMTGTLTVS